MKKYVSRFHYLTQDLPNRSHPEQARIACENGANWIQYRCMSKSDEELLDDIFRIAELCDEWGATLIVTNHVHLVHEADIQGVHIEDFTADLREIRNRIGDEKTLGASATQFSQVKKAYAEGADYTGFGPFAFTETKPNDFVPVGIEGYRKLVGELKNNAIDVPVIACGGVQTASVGELMATGIHGIAASSAVNLSDDAARAIKTFYRAVH
ncbi:MAG: thiamine phosphate synthase [Mucilaginibacter polytrichastri]|nr:thiamine phosphate synthase [Mucilaginibacter polytrichastri]